MVAIRYVHKLLWIECVFNSKMCVHELNVSINLYHIVEIEICFF